MPSCHLLSFVNMDKNINFSGMSPTEAIEAKQESVRQSLKKKKQQLTKNGVLLTEERKAIIGMHFKELHRGLSEGKIKSKDALEAFQAKALIETEKNNCITEFIPDAEAWAKERDALPANQRGKLHGLPVSIKENFDVKGMDTTMGLTKRLGHPLENNAVLVDVLLHQGAVPFVKTNVPQLIYSVGCSNPIFGATTNPHDSTRSPGGSSGGETALIVGGGSVLGIGTDMGGSIRIPAVFCGTFGIKPGQKRISRNGAHGTYESMVGVANASGFLGRDVDALAAGMEAILTDNFMFKLDPPIVPLLWRKELYESKKKLTIGWFEQEDFLPVTSGCKRAVREAKDALKKRGHKVVPFGIPDFEHLFNIALDVMLSEGGTAMLKHWEGGEIITEAAKYNKKVISAPSWVKRIIELYLGIWSPLMAKMASQNAIMSRDLWHAVGLQKAYNDSFFEKWNAESLDVLLGPTFPCPAPHPAHHGELMTAVAYFGIYNFLDMPAGTIPVSFETAEDQKQLKDYPETDYLFKIIKKTAAGTQGLPLSVQLAALPWEEEKLLYSMKELELALEEFKDKEKEKESKIKNNNKGKKNATNKENQTSNNSVEEGTKQGKKSKKTIY